MQEHMKNSTASKPLAFDLVRRACIGLILKCLKLEKDYAKLFL